MKPEELTEQLIVEALCDKEPLHYQDYEDFAKDCHSVSLALVQSGLLGEGGPDGPRVARGACRGVGGQHSWVVLGRPYEIRATIVDITLWSYNPDQPRIWIGDMRSGLHRPKGFELIYTTEKPQAQGRDVIPLDTTHLSEKARTLLQAVGPLDAPGWGALWSRCGMAGWPAREVLEAFLDQHPESAALVPIDIVGMVTDRNPESLYW